MLSDKPKGHRESREYITFVLTQLKPKTQVWAIVTNDTWVSIGYIKWYGPWRKYCFFPSKDTVFENVCMREITEFLLQLTSEHKAIQKLK